MYTTFEGSHAVVLGMLGFFALLCFLDSGANSAFVELCSFTSFTSLATASFPGSYTGTCTSRCLQTASITSSHFAFIFIAAVLSCAVHCRLQITRRSDNRGSVLAGGIFKEVPMTTDRVDSKQTCLAFFKTSSLSRSPKCTTTSFKSLPHESHARPVLCRCRPLCGFPDVTSKVRLISVTSHSLLSHVSRNTLPCSSLTKESQRPARWCSPSTFCVTTCFKNLFA
mmetsp:Transcript_3046/g.11497  ORF Transcript_3046/g.11497 Transcript_3046/m.11497 type:complete len:225 (-) Transcript_3046:557-1231(-)